MKFSAIIFFISFFQLAFGQTVERDSIADSLVVVAKSQLGTPYKWATSNPDVSFDCSGFTAYVYGEFDITDCRSSKGYSNIGTEVSIENAKPGDCILFTGTKASDRSVGHVGIVVSNSEEGLQFIHCSSSKKHFGVVVTDYESSGYPKRFHSVRRLF